MTEHGDNDWFGDDTATFGDRVAAAREAAGLSQADLARNLGVRLKTVRGWENDTSEPRANKLQMLAGLLGVSLMWLLNAKGDGIQAPASDALIQTDPHSLQAEVQTLRVEMEQTLDRVRRLEKRLRQTLHLQEQA